jgi:DNA-binding MarR family transcriptional regulator
MQFDGAESLLKFSRVCCKLNHITCRNFNLTAGEFQCLLSLYIDKPSSIRELSEIIWTRRTTTSKLLNSLEKKFIIRRELDLKDKRIEKVFLTPAGEEFSRKVVSFYKNKFLSISGLANTERLGLFVEFLNQLSFEAEKSTELKDDLF